jgi:hypothetical protein
VRLATAVSWSVSDNARGSLDLGAVGMGPAHMDNIPCYYDGCKWAIVDKERIRPHMNRVPFIQD